MDKKQKGFGLTELLVVLVIMASLGMLTYSVYNRESKKQALNNEIATLTSFATAIGNYVNVYQGQLVQSLSPAPITAVYPVNSTMLQANGFLPKNQKYTYIKDPYKPTRKLYPCTQLFYANNQLQGFIYFRTDDGTVYSKNDIKKSNLALSSGLAGNGDLGILNMESDGTMKVRGNNINWSLNKNQVNSYLGPNARCQGNYLAYPSYVYYLGNILSFQKTQLNATGAVSQYNQYESINQNTKSFSLDSSVAYGANPAFQNIAQNKLIFQTNPNCVMDPSKLSTMQDYDPNTPSSGTLNDFPNLSTANKFGCRNRQLSLGVQTLSGTGVNNKATTAITINGFTQNTTSSLTNNNNSYLGSVSTYAVQPSALVGYAASCPKTDIGTMAKQDPDPASELSGTPPAIIKFHQLNQNLMVCQKNILCPGSTLSTINSCWLPLNTMNIDINFQQSDKVIAFKAPQGYYIKPGSVKYFPTNTQYGTIVQQRLNVSQTGNRPYNKSLTDTNGGQGKCHFNICVNDSPFGCITTRYTDGWLNQITSNGQPFGAYIDIGNLDTSVKNTNASWNTLSSTAKGWSVWTEAEISNGSYQFNLLNPFRYWQPRGSEQNATWVSQNGVPQMVVDGKALTVVVGGVTKPVYQPNAGANYGYQATTNLPVIANPYYYIYATGWGSNGIADCDGWKGTQQLITDIRYISNVTITNDTSEMNISSANVPIPPSPDSNVVVDKIAFYGQILCDDHIWGQNNYFDKNDKTIYHVPSGSPGACWRSSYPKEWETFVEYYVNSTVPVNTIMATATWDASIPGYRIGYNTQPFYVTSNIQASIDSAKAAGLNFTYRYTAYNDNSCMPAAGQNCALWTDSTRTKPYYTLRTSPP